MFVRRVREWEKSEGNLGVCLFLLLAPFLAVMLVALCFAVTSWPIKTLAGYKMISSHTWAFGTKRWFKKECEPSVLPAPPVDRLMDQH